VAKLNLEKLRKYIQSFKFQELFNELGWDNSRLKPIEINDTKLTAIAEKRGFLVFVCDASQFPNVAERKKIAKQIGITYHEHLIIYCNPEKQIWQIAVKELNKPIQYKEVQHHNHQEPQVLIEKLRGIFFSLEEEENISLIDVTNRVNENFNANTEKTTKKFYDLFKKQHTAFMGHISGLENPDNKRWYASLMLNRLMFIYFIQKKGFLDDNVHYLREKLKQIQSIHGEDNFYSFYRNFLLPFFHDGLGKEHRENKELIKLIGNVPYLNGGLFDVHELEKDDNDIQVNDEAFETLFAFFDQYQWHLDTNQNATGNEINPDVIGYIFEKYINDRAAMGAYYTKEDITEYISKNTIIPFLFDKAKIDCANAFKSDSSLWQLLKENPDRYIYDAVKKGCISNDELPENIAIGINTNEPNLLERRKNWNSPTPENFGLPTEIWRETIARRQRYFELKAKLENGEITELNDFITYNLNVRQFAQDALEFYEGSDFIEAFYNAIEKITILDPTCGSGAFLFAALNILEPLYEACIKRMREFIENAKLNQFLIFRSIIDEIDTHQNPTYWIYKKIILNNLYGVDIMPEAVEIAKLRLFLKLAAMAEVNHKKPNLGLEPLPDIDFNIRFGNTLVGFASFEEFEKQASAQIFYQGEKGRIVEKLNHVKQSFEQFKNTQLNGLDCRIEKQAYKNDLLLLQTEMNRYLAIQYGKDATNLTVLNAFRESHQPFHWFAEFYEIIHEKKGFDVIIGNPPYVPPKDLAYDLKITNYKCSDLYGYVINRCFSVINEKSRFGLIVMHNLAFSRNFADPRKLLKQNTANSWFSFFARIPAGLFSGDVRVRNCIFLSELNENVKNKKSYTTKIHRWFSEAREFLLSKLNYSQFSFNDAIPMIDSPVLSDFFENSKGKNLAYCVTSNSKNKLFFKQSAYNWIAVSPEPAPCFDKNENLIAQSQVSDICFNSEQMKNYALLFLNGKLFFSQWLTFGDEFHLTKDDLTSVKVPFDDIDETDKKILNDLSERFAASLKDTIQFKLNAGKNVGTFKTSKLWHITDQSDLIFLKYMTKNPIGIFNAIENHVFQTVITVGDDL
jgi:hypothetical protein